MRFEIIAKQSFVEIWQRNGEIWALVKIGEKFRKMLMLEKISTKTYIFAGTVYIYCIDGP